MMKSHENLWNAGSMYVALNEKFIKYWKILLKGNFVRFLAINMIFTNNVKWKYF